MFETPAPSAERVLALVREVPSGRVTSYGAIARLTNLPAVLVGGIMARLLGDVEPWWRVVGADGTILTHKRAPEVGRDQTERLRAEGVGFDDLGRVRMAEFRYEL